MNIENIEKAADLIKSFKEEYAQDILWGSAPDGNVRADTLIVWIVRNRHLIKLCDDIEKLHT